MNKKGFTLIELLAIIVILAVIALIGFPIVTNIINQSRISAAERTCDGIADAVENLYRMSVLVDPSFPGVTITFSGSDVSVNDAEGTAYDKAKFEFNGTKPTAGSATIAQDGGITWTPLTVNTYECEFDEARNTFDCHQPTEEGE